MIPISNLSPLFFIIILSVLISACSPVKVLNGLIPTENYVIKRDIAYGTHPRQQLDIYLPKGQPNPNTPLPVIVFFYGGSWDSGEKEDYLFAAEAFASKGYMVVIPNYRVYPDVKFPQLMQDPASAAKWVKTHISAYGGDTHTIFLAGHSAGAHLVTMLALNPDYLAQVSLTPLAFNGYVGLAGPYDFLPLKSARLKAIFGSDETQRAAQPIHYVRGDNPPLLLAVGLQDGTVWPRNTFHLAQAIRAQHGQVEVIEFPKYGHVDMVAKLAKPLRGNSELLNAIVQFLQGHSALHPVVPQ